MDEGIYERNAPASGRKMLAVRERVQAHRLSTCSRLRGSGVAMWWAPRPPVQMNFTRRGGHTHTATQAQATAHYRPQRTAHRREASGEGFTIRRASRVGGNPPPNSNACACSLCACGVQAAAQHRNPGWVLFRSSGGFRLRWVSKSDAPLATGWVGSSALRSHLQPPATLLVTCLAHGFGQHPL